MSKNNEANKYEAVMSKIMMIGLVANVSEISFRLINQKLST